MNTGQLYLVVILVFGLSYGARGAEPTVSSTVLDQATLTFIRHGFYEALQSHRQTDRMIQFIETKYTQEYIYSEPVLLAYYGVLNALKAKHVFNPFSKISYLRSALRKLDEAVIDGDRTLEVRFLRFAVLHNLPSFLGFSDKLNADRDAVYELLVADKQYADLPSDLALNVIEFVIDSKRLNEQQQSTMESLAQRLKTNEQLSVD